MYKLSHFLGQSDYGIGAVPLFGKADSAFEKVASSGLLPDVVRYIEGLRPNNDSQYVLVNALGAGEYYGSNINGDAFTEASLIHMPENWTGVPLIDKVVSKNWPYGFPTFYNAHPFAHHRNKDASKAFGEVELATWNPLMRRVELVVRVDYNKCQQFGGTGVWDRLRLGQYPDVSMGTKVPFDTCFPAGTLIRTRTGHKPIEQLRPGDVVLTHTGMERPITAVMSRTADDLLEIVAAGLPKLAATENHPFLVVRREQLRACKGTANGRRVRHTFSEDGVKCRRCGTTPAITLVWSTAAELRPGDYLALPVSVSDGPQPTLSRARMLGYYLGDGYIIKQRTGKKKDGEYRDMGFGFSVGRSETAHLQRLLDTLSGCELANEANVYAAGAGRRALIVSVYDQKAAAWLQQHGGRTCEEKYLSSEVFSWSLEAKLELVAGYLDTDGSVDAISGQARIASINRGLLLDVQRLLLSVGITATICFAGASSGYGAEAPCWYLCLSAAQTQKLLDRSTKVTARDVSWESPQSLFWGGYWLTPVKMVKELDGEVDVFNIAVEDDESYVAEGRAVHNCSICLDWQLYREALATYDPKKHVHPGQAALQFHKRLLAKNGKGIRGLSVTRRDYCDHAKTMMSRIFPDGRKVWVFNDFPRFFDISFVFIGADKTAKVMLFIFHNGKAYSVKPSAQVAEEAGVLDDGPQEKTASIEEELFKAAFGKLAKPKRAAIEKDVIPSQFAGKAVPLLTRGEPHIPSEMLDQLGNLPLRNVLSTTAGMGIVLRPREFQRITIIQLGKKPLADKLDEEGSVFARSDEEEPVEMGSDYFLPALAKILAPLMAGRSALGPIVEKRVVMSSGPEEKIAAASSHTSPLLAKIGAAYNGYRRGVMEIAAHTQELAGKDVTSAELCKLASAPVDAVFTPLTVAYLTHAYLDEFGVSGQGVVKLSNGNRQRGEGNPLEEHAAM